MSAFSFTVFAPSHTNIGSGDGTIIGRIVEKEHGNGFEYSRNTEGDAAVYPHLVWVTNKDIGGAFKYRKAIVKKTVAYIWTDVADDGSHVVEKWELKKNMVYSR